MLSPKAVQVPSQRAPSQRKINLENKANQLRSSIHALERSAPAKISSRISTYETIDELYGQLARVNAELKMIRQDPLTHELCQEIPWAEECKVYDV